MRFDPSFRPVSIAAIALLVLGAVAGCDGGDDCLSHASTFCTNGVTYWMSACGAREEAVETCTCGCAADQTTCRSCDCEPQCTGRACGPDGCGGTCAPGCSGGQVCTAAGACEQCQPACEGRTCGPDGCGGECPPGCGAGEACTAAGTCDVCEIDCGGRECGADGCGGTCSPGCGAGEACTAEGLCEACTPDCAGRECGDDGCGQECAPGCGQDQRCTDEGRCVGCTLDCAGRFCGDDGCGGSCGVCAAGLECAAGGQCVAPVCGDVPVTIAGAFENGVADVSFDTAAIDLDHKMDVDAFEDGCVTRVEAHLTRGTGCQLDVVAAGRYTADGGLVVQSVRFAADSFCPGFADEDEGEYVGGDGLDVGVIVPGVTAVPGRTVAESCVATTFLIRLKGNLARVSDGQELAVAATEIAVGGEFVSAGDTESTCPCRPECEGRQCGPDGCGDVCGTCADGAQCSAEGQCLARPDGSCWDGAAWRQKAVPAAGDVVVTELMPNPAVVDDSDGEWFEVWLARDIDLNGLSLGRDPAGAPDLVVPEGDCQRTDGGRHLLFARSADAATNGGLPPVERTFSFTLANSDGRLFVGYEGTLHDVVTWTTARAGVSRSLEPTTTDPTLNDDPMYWCDAAEDDTFGAGDRGTPGAGNGSCGVTLATCTDGGVLRPKVVPEVGDLVINEVMPDPAAATDANGEWFEVSVERDVDLNGLQIGRDTLGADPVVPEGACVRVAAGTQLVFAKTADSGANGGLPAVAAVFAVSLVNSAGVLRIGIGGRDLDAVTWSSSTSGAARQLDPAHRTPAGNDDAGSWCPATAVYGAGDHGTPGAPNASCL